MFTGFVQVEAAVARDGDHRELLGAVLHLPDLGHFHLKPEFHDVRREHEDDEQHQDHVHQGHDVDVGQGARSPEPASSRSCAAVA